MNHLKLKRPLQEDKMSSHKVHPAHSSNAIVTIALHACIVPRVSIQLPDWLFQSGSGRCLMPPLLPANQQMGLRARTNEGVSASRG